MSRKGISIFLATCILLSLFSVSVFAYGDLTVDVVGEASGTCGDTASWTLSEGGLLTISGAGAMTDFEDEHEVPWKDSRANILSVVVQSGITHVGTFSFYGCENVKTITLGKDVADIGDNAFFACSSLTAIDVHASNAVYKSASGVLYSKDGKTLVSCPNGKNGEFIVGDSVEIIGDHAFYGCTKITKIDTKNASIIERGAFSACQILSSIIIGKNVTSIGDSAFANCVALMGIDVSTENSAFRSIDGIVYSKDGKNLVCCPYGKSGDIVISATTENIERYAFYKCNLITSVVIPDNVKSIGEYSFGSCEALTSVKIGKGITNIPKEAFSHCIVLTDVTIGENVEVIGDYAFHSCEGLKKIVIPDSVTKIGQSAFQRCYKLREVVFGKKVDNIGRYAFCQCNQLLSVTLPESVKTIGFRAFGYTVKGSSYTYYVVEGFTIKAPAGSAAQTYATKHKFTFVEYVPEPQPEPEPEPQPDITALPEHDFYMNVTDSTMPNVVAKTTVSQLSSGLLEFGVTAQVKDKNGNEISDTALLTTGSKVIDSKGKEYTVIVCGDVDGSGTVDATDYLQIKKLFLKELVLEGVYFSAADADNDGSINSTDYLKIKNYFLGTLDLYA